MATSKPGSEGEAIEREGAREGGARAGRVKRGVAVRLVRRGEAAPHCIPCELRRGEGSPAVERIEGEFSTGMVNIAAMRKMGGSRWTQEILVIGWATGRNVLDGLEIADK